MIEKVTGDLELIEITVADAAPAAGKTLAAVSLPGALVVTDRQSGAFPSPETTLEPGRRYVLAVQTAVTDEVVRLLRG